MVKSCSKNNVSFHSPTITRFQVSEALTAEITNRCPLVLHVTFAKFSLILQCPMGDLLVSLF